MYLFYFNKNLFFYFILFFVNITIWYFRGSVGYSTVSDIESEIQYVSGYKHSTAFYCHFMLHAVPVFKCRCSLSEFPSVYELIYRGPAV